MDEIKEILGISADGGLVCFEKFTSIYQERDGATGYIMYPLTQEYIDEMNEGDNVKEYYRDLWVEAVKNGNTEDSLEDFAEEGLSYDDESLYPGDDPSFRYITEEAVENLSERNKKLIDEHLGKYKTWSCQECGRIFPVEMKVIFNEELMKEINEAEKRGDERIKNEEAVH